MRSTLFLSIAVGLAGLALPCASSARDPMQAPGKHDGERLKVLVDKPSREVAALPDLTAAPVAELVARTGIATAMVQTMRRYQVFVAGEVEAYVVALVDLDYQGKVIRIGASRNPAGATHGVHAFDEFGKVIPELDLFFGQFRGPAGIGLTLLSQHSIAEVIQRRDAVFAASKPPPAKDDKTAWVLLQHLRLMQQMDERFNAVYAAAAADGGSLRTALRALLDHITAVNGFAGQLIALLKPKSVGQYRKFVEEAQKHVEAAIIAVENDDKDAADKIIKSKLKFSCSRCHGWDGNEFKKPFESAFAHLRGEAGFGPGVFVVGVDVRPFDLPQDQAQQLATAVKVVLLAAR